jgi:two-component system, NarL family, nitrate/nitrite response regulator NarL
MPVPYLNCQDGFHIVSYAMILVASPSKELRQRWRNALMDTFRVCEVSDKNTLVYLLKKLEPTVVFFDYDLGGQRRLAVIRELMNLRPNLRMAVFSSNPTESEGAAVIKAGAKGYSQKNLDKALLKKIVRVICKNEQLWIGRNLFSALVNESIRAERLHSPAQAKTSLSALEGLSPRQTQIASLIGIGEHNKAISDHLNINEKTVKAHLTVIFRKLGVSSRTQLAVAVNQNHAPQQYPSSAPIRHLTSPN